MLKTIISLKTSSVKAISKIVHLEQFFPGPWRRRSNPLRHCVEARSYDSQRFDHAYLTSSPELTVLDGAWFQPESRTNFDR